MKISMLPAAALFLLSSMIPVAGQEKGDVKIHFEYGGAPPAPAVIKPDKDTEYCGKHELFNEELIVNPENKGIQNVVLYLYTSGRGSSEIDPVPPANKKHTLANHQCRFDPHIVIAQTGDTLVVTNPDPIGHNANLQFIRNTPQNVLIPAGQEKEVLLESPEPALIPVDCNIHPWMHARILVLEHPYAALSDKKGDLIIKGVPAGKKLVFRVYHESLNDKFEGMEVKGEEISRRNTFEVDVQPGVNDLGKIVVVP